jgi:hypothetical protein
VHIFRNSRDFGTNPLDLLIDAHRDALARFGREAQAASFHIAFGK